MFMIDKTNHQIQEVFITRYRSGNKQIEDDFVAIESPLQININHRPTTITMRTPGDDIALALGFLFTEGMLGNIDDIEVISQIDKNTVNIIPREGYKIEAASLERNFYSTSSCGVCGKSSVESIMSKSKYVPPVKNTEIKHETLFGLQEHLRSLQAAFEVTGGIHASAIFDPDGRYLYHSEDVGRHNALDKLIGHALMAGKIPLDEHILLLSGRASFELIQKASMAGIPIIASVGAPSSLAVDLASANELTLVGFLKKTGFNVYAGQHRLI